MNSEIWKAIKGYEGKYEVSNLAKIRSLLNTNEMKRETPKVLKLQISKSGGYYVIGLFKKSNRQLIKVHRLVAENFIPNTQNKPFVNHKDGNKLNNAINNLEWCNSLENNIHAYENGLKQRGENVKCSKLQNHEVLEIFNSNIPRKELALNYGICYSVVYGIQAGWQWNHITGLPRKSKSKSLYINEVQTIMQLKNCCGNM